MIRAFLLALLGALVFASLHGNVSSQTLYSTPSSHSSNGTTNTHLMMEDDFVPDTLRSEDDDAEDELAEKSDQGKIETVNKVVSSKAMSGLLRPLHSQQGRVEKNSNEHKLLMKETGQAPDVKTTTSTLLKKGIVSHVSRPRSKLPFQSQFSSRTLASTHVATSASSGEQQMETSPASEEEKLRMTTRKLVKWLRNRLRKRLEDVASLEEKCDVEKKLLTHLNDTIKAEASERQSEIKTKLETQNELKDVRRHFDEPERELREVRAENSHLVDQLTRLKSMYNDLAVTRKEIEDKLVSAGFTYWLDKRGKEYLPATAVGVLSKSARIFDPVSRGLEEVLKMDELFSSGVESVIPISQRSLISKVLRDLALLLPVIPVIMLLWRISQISQRLSVLHLVMYISTIFAIESSLLFGLSLIIGAEIIREIQRSYELFVVTGVFVDGLLFIVMIGMQLLVMSLHTSKSEIIQSLLSLAVGYHFFRNVFQPVVVSQFSTTTTAAHSVYAINFIIIAFEKKATLKVGTRFDKHLNALLLSIERWVCETFQAMKDLFVDTLPDMSDDETTSTERSHSSYNTQLRAIEPTEDQPSYRKDADVEEVTKVLNATRGYARWTAGRTADPGTEAKPAFRGIRWYQANPQLTLLESGSRRRARQEHMSSQAEAPELFRPGKKRFADI